MQSKNKKKQKLQNNPYIQEENIPLAEHLPTNLSLRVNKLSNSLYSTKQTYELSSWQIQNIKLKAQIQKLQQNIIEKQNSFNAQVQSLNKLLQQRNVQINELKLKIYQLQRTVQLKNIYLKEKLQQCEDLIKQIEQKQLKSNIHSLLQTSRKQRMAYSKIESPRIFVNNQNIVGQFANKFISNQLNNNPVRVRSRSPPIVFHSNSNANLINYKNATSPINHVRPNNENNFFTRNNASQVRKQIVDQIFRPLNGQNYRNPIPKNHIIHHQVPMNYQMKRFNI